MKISVITPTFNSAKTIEKTIVSVISQKSACSLEYIIIDGGSTDETRAIIEKYQAQIDVFISERDAGPYDAMNKGICQATGDIIGIINSDDWYNAGAIDTVANEFMSNPEISVLYTPVENYYEGEHVATFSPGSLEKMPIRFTLNHPSCFIKKAAYDQVGLYDLQYKITADYDLLLRMYKSGLEFYFVAKPLACYSLNGMSSSTNFFDRMSLIHESWRISTKYHTQELMYERRRAYAVWTCTEFFSLPIRHLLKPHNARKLKTFLFQHIRKPISDSYGKW